MDFGRPAGAGWKDRPDGPSNTRFKEESYDPCASLSPVRPTTSVPSSFPNCARPDTRSFVGLARSDASAAALAATGAEAHRGTLDDLDDLDDPWKAASAADGVIHLAFIHNFADYAAAGAADLHAVEAIADALADSSTPFVVTSGTAGLTSGRVGTRRDASGRVGTRRDASGRKTSRSIRREPRRREVPQRTRRSHWPSAGHGRR
ncbi:hypothetical protein GCM10009753_72930 [Streptantibioticus ferralitis]